jgi:hypothetical protein
MEVGADEVPMTNSGEPQNLKDGVRKSNANRKTRVKQTNLLATNIPK